MTIKKEGDKFVLYSEDGSKRLSKPGTKAETVKRLRQVEYFKKVKKSVEDSTMANPIFDNSGKSRYEDVMTAFSAMSNAQPAELEAFLKSIHNTPMEEEFRRVVEVYKGAGKAPEQS